MNYFPTYQALVALQTDRERHFARTHARRLDALQRAEEDQGMETPRWWSLRRARREPVAGNV